ncbi:sialidase family protein [Lysinibacillus sp. RS5]|uniref:sialidase family protein n=1 Tax=unclassified Lysinibacillus TaxID=2636778 RepID=UPI0035BE289F
MKTKFESLLNTGKNKALAVAAFGVLTLTVGSDTIYAAHGDNIHNLSVEADKGSNSYSTNSGMNKIKYAPKGANADGSSAFSVGTRSAGGELNSFAVRQNADGVTEYSTDGGKTWTKNAPKGAVVTKNADGSSDISVGTQPAGGVLNIAVRQNADGVTEYSTDGGKTWTKNVPKGAVVTKNADGSSAFSVGTRSAGGELNSFAVRQNADGVTEYSTDGGKTWTKNAPKGAVVTKNADGSSDISVGTQPAGGVLNIAVRQNADGVTEYSTDGGKTWTKNAPKGAVVTKNADGSSTLSVGAQSAGGELNGFAVRQNADGVTEYSTDGGKTWTKNAPKGAVVTKNADGSSDISVGTQPAGGVLNIAVRQNADGSSTLSVGAQSAGGELNGFAVRQNADGVTEYSTDGGKTWTKNAPKGLEKFVPKTEARL